MVLVSMVLIIKITRIINMIKLKGKEVVVVLI